MKDNISTHRTVGFMAVVGSSIKLKFPLPTFNKAGQWVISDCRTCRHSCCLCAELPDSSASLGLSWKRKRYGRCKSGDCWRFAWTANRHLPDASAVFAGKWNALQIHHGSSDSRRIMSRMTANARPQTSTTAPALATARRLALVVSECDVHHLALLSWLHSCCPGIIEQGCFSGRPVWHLISVELCPW